MRSRVPLLVAVLLGAALLVGAGPAGAQPPAEETRLDLQLQNDGDANWTIVATVPLEDEGDVENFRSFAEAYEGGEQDFRLGVEAFRRAADAASAETGRAMTVVNSTRSAELVRNASANATATDAPAAYGELRVSFTWENFARIGDNDTMYVGDAFRTENGTWLSGLGANQTLVIRSPPGYSSPTSSPTGPVLEDGDLTWTGPRTFEPGYFEIVYEPQPGGTQGPGFGVSTALLAGALVLSATALLLGLYLLYRRRDTDAPTRPPSEAAADAGKADDADAATATADVATPTGTEDASSQAGEPADSASADEAPDVELLSDEERVEYLLEDNGGRMKQADIVKETGWSNAKVSQLLSSMAEADRVDKLRIGRENLISLPDEGVGDLESDDDT